MDLIEVLRSPKIGWRAKGVYAFLVIAQRETNLSITEIMENGIDGYYSVMKAVQDLENNGMLEREKQNNGDMKYKLK